MPYSTYIGIDPGWKNLGLSILKKDTETGKVSLVLTAVMNPSSYKNLIEFVKAFDEVITPLAVQLKGVSIERFVPYNNVYTAESESINQVIGALTWYFGGDWEIAPVFYRAIDWKVSLVKHLVTTKGFDNPSNSLDKKFTMAAAKACLDEGSDIQTDHEGDATCLSYIGTLSTRDKNEEKTSAVIVANKVV